MQSAATEGATGSAATAATERASKATRCIILLQGSSVVSIFRKIIRFAFVFPLACALGTWEGCHTSTHKALALRRRQQQRRRDAREHARAHTVTCHCQCLSVISVCVWLCVVCCVCVCVWWKSKSWCVLWGLPLACPNVTVLQFTVNE